VGISATQIAKRIGAEVFGGAQIVLLRRDWLANSEVSGELGMSPRTVEYHLPRCAKLQIGSRSELDRALTVEPRRGADGLKASRTPACAIGIPRRPSV
jgi:hypothetical protein